MAPACDHTSVGILVWNEGELLLIERANFPFGYAVPAGHVDGDSSFEESAQRELREEVGLETKHLKLLAEGRRDNVCRRKDGSWHHWKMYEAQASGKLMRSESETKRADWFTREKIRVLAERTEKYSAKEISESEWEENPGLEPVMYEWFRELKIV